MKVKYLGDCSKKALENRIRIVATAGNLSRSSGTVTEVYNKHDDYNNNLKLARAVVGYGHKSISEHDYIVLAVENVTPIVEQTLIGYRLTSFTIKSRRNVDFRNVGFYTPNFKDKNGQILKSNKRLQKKYSNYMKSLFTKYGEYADEGLPIEDCRYILPYSFYSNIIMGCDANELLRMTCDFLYGKLSKITEIFELGNVFKQIIIKYVPYLEKALENETESTKYQDYFTKLDLLVKYNDKVNNKVVLTNYTKNADDIVLTNIIKNRYQYSFKESKDILNNLIKNDSDIQDEMIDSLIKTKNQRELEQVIFSFEFPISLAVLTHITRHRMHSLLIPDFVPLWNLENFIIPETLNKYKKEYKKIFADKKKIVEEFQQEGVRDEDLIYFYQSGNTCNVSTTMNARSLEWISRMRCCNKAQWEIRNIVKSMVKEAQKVAPIIGKCLGPSCKVEGFCPEGKDSCKNRGVVILNNKKN